jgi:RecA-family ATPase
MDDSLFNDVIVCGTKEVDIEKEDEWLLEPFLPTKSISLLDGPSCVGKSFFALEMAYALAAGSNFLGISKTIQPTNVLYISAEETKHMLLKRIKNIVQHYPATDNFVWLSTLDDNFKVSTRLFKRDYEGIKQTEMANVLKKLIEKYQVKLVVLDSLINFFGLDENSTEDVIIFHEYLKSLIKKYDCSFLLVHHQTKETLKGRAGIFRGSEIFRDQARTRIVMSNEDEYKKIEIEKSNYYSPLLDVFPIFLKFADGVWQRVIEPKKNKQETKNNNIKKKRVMSIKPSYDDRF